MKPLRPNPRLLSMWRGMSAEQKRVFASHVKSAPNTLRQYVEGWRTIQPELAIRIEDASVQMRAEGVKRIDRTQLSAVCRGCSYAKAMKKLDLT